MIIPKIKVLVTARIGKPMIACGDRASARPQTTVVRRSAKVNRRNPTTATKSPIFQINNLTNYSMFEKLTIIIKLASQINIALYKENQVISFQLNAMFI